MPSLAAPMVLKCHNLVNSGGNFLNIFTINVKLRVRLLYPTRTYNVLKKF